MGNTVSDNDSLALTTVAPPPPPPPLSATRPSLLERTSVAAAERHLVVTVATCPLYSWYAAATTTDCHFLDLVILAQTIQLEKQDPLDESSFEFDDFLPATKMAADSPFSRSALRLQPDGADGGTTEISHTIGTMLNASEQLACSRLQSTIEQSSGDAELSEATRALEKVIAERDALARDYCSLHERAERSNDVLRRYRANQEEYQRELERSLQHTDQLRANISSLASALTRSDATHSAELARCRAALRMSATNANQLEQEVQRKQAEKEQLNLLMSDVLAHRRLPPQ